MNYVIFGASSGLGLGLAEALAGPGDVMWLISRSRPSICDKNDRVERIWIQADLSKSGWTSGLSVVGNVPIDMLVFSAGTWESDPDITNTPSHEFYDILGVNTAAFIAGVVALFHNLVSAKRGYVVAIGSTASLENATGPRAAYAASKFGIRGAVHGLRELFRSTNVGVCCLSPGGLASDVPFGAGLDEALRVHAGERIPTQDIAIMIKALSQLSFASCVKEIDMPAQKDEGV